MNSSVICLKMWLYWILQRLKTWNKQLGRKLKRWRIPRWAIATFLGMWFRIIQHHRMQIHVDFLSSICYPLVDSASILFLGYINHTQGIADAWWLHWSIIFSVLLTVLLTQRFIILELQEACLGKFLLLIS